MDKPVFSISIHALREEGDQRLTHLMHAVIISIHALREEGDCKSFKQFMEFY